MFCGHENAFLRSPPAGRATDLEKAALEKALPSSCIPQAAATKTFLFLRHKDFSKDSLTTVLNIPEKGTAV